MIEAHYAKQEIWRARLETRGAFPDGVILALRMKYPNYRFEKWESGRYIHIYDRDWDVQIPRERIKEVIDYIADYFKEAGLYVRA